MINPNSSGQLTLYLTEGDRYRHEQLYVEEALAAGREFVQRQVALVSMWEILCDWQDCDSLSEDELDALSDSLCFFCCFLKLGNLCGYQVSIVLIIKTYEISMGKADSQFGCHF